MPKICPSIRRNPGHSSGFHSHAPRYTRTSRFSSYSSYSASEARKKNVFIQSSTGSNPISNLVQSVSHLVQRIFKANAYITTNWKDTGLIAADQMYGFSENLKTPGKKSIKLPPNAFYVPIETRPASCDVGTLGGTPSSTLGSYYMPSILFEGAKEKDVIHYYLKNRKIELTLKQQLHPHENGRQNFEDFFASLKHYFVSNLQKPRQPIYLFSQDIPPGIPCLGFRALDSTFTMTYSPETNRWEFLNFNDLQLFKDSLENSAQFEVLNSSYQADSSTFILGATGLKKEDLKLLVDRNYLALIGKRTPGCGGEAIEGFHRIPTLLSFQLTENRMIDFKKTTLQIQPNGIAELTVAFKSDL